MRTFILLICFASGFSLWGQQLTEAFNTSLRDQLQYDVGVNDIWGYAAPDGTEYALVGLGNALSIVSLADPDNIVEVQRIPGQSTIWRDIKTYGQRAYVVSDNTTEGLLVVDLEPLPADTATYRYLRLPHPPNDGTFRRAHNIYIDVPSGLAYLAGSNLNAGGMLIYDVASQPDTVLYTATAPNTYSHDVYVQDGVMYASEIYEGELAIYDVSTPDSIVELGRVQTPSDFTHNAWTTADANYVFTCDERPDAPVAAYDISDPSDPVLLDEFRPARSLGLGTIPHNVHVLDEYLVTSYYTDGLSIADASVPDNIIEVGYFDSYPDSLFGFNGNWGAYPFLPSGLVLMTDRTYGLHVVEVDYKRGARLQGTITDANTGLPINNVSVAILGPDDEPLALTDATGEYRTGSAFAGDFSATFTAFGYDELSVPVSLENGVITVLDTSLVSSAVNTTEFSALPGLSVAVYPNPSANGFQLNLPGGIAGLRSPTWQLFDASGRLLRRQTLLTSQRIGADLAPGTYWLRIVANGRPVYATKLVRQ